MGSPFVRMSVYIINISPENWSSCDKGKIFGIPESETVWYRLDSGDITLARLALTQNKPCGCVGVWEFLRDEEVPVDRRVGPNPVIPWSDNAYRLKQYFTELAKFDSPFDEGFGGRRRFSEKLGWQAQRLRGSILRLTKVEAGRYVRLLLKEKATEISLAVTERLKSVVG